MGQLEDSLRNMAALQAGAMQGVTLVLERLLARVYEDDPDELASLAKECLDALDNSHAQFKPSQLIHETLLHATTLVEAIFQGAQRLVDGDEEGSG